MVVSYLKKHLGFILFSALLLVGLFTYKTYGMSWDEKEQRGIGLISYNYLVHGDSTLRHFSNNVYGVGVELPLVIIEKVFRMKDVRSIFWMRHGITHLFLVFGAWAFFLLIDGLYKNKLLATLGFGMLVAMPLIYTHSFYNTKDVPFLSMYIICFWLAYRAFQKNTVGSFVMLGLGCGYLTNIRIMGILLVACISLFFLIDYIGVKKDLVKKKQIRTYFWIFLATALGTLYITWPYLYSNPVQNFTDAFKNMSRHGWEGIILFNGRSVKSTEVPWNYALTWFGITTPLIYLAAGITGIVFLIVHFFRNPGLFLTDKLLRNQSLYVIGFFQPLVSVILFHSIIFDAWRHLYFIYPSFILMAIYGLHELFKTRMKWVVVLVIVTGIGWSGEYMISNFPFQNIYFNVLAGKQEPEALRKRWELDYWGNSFKQALEYIARTDTSRHITLAVSHPSVIFNRCMLPPSDSARFIFKGYENDAERADYFISGYRNHPEDYPFQAKAVYSIRVENSAIATVFKARR